MELLPVQVPRTQFIQELRNFIDRSWGEVTDDEHASCVGLPLLGLIRVGLLPPGFDANLSVIAPSQRLAWLLRLLHRNAHAVDPGLESNQLKAGDLLLSCWADADNTRSVVHHVAIWTGSEPLPYGTHLQSLAREHGGAGMVYEAPMSHLDWHRIESVWRLNALTDGEV